MPASKGNFQLSLTDEELTELKKSYEKEYIELSRRLEYLRSMLTKAGSTIVKGGVEERQKRLPREGTGKRTLPGPRQPKRRGPRSVWGDFIVQRLRKLDRPMSYAEMLEDAMEMHSIPKERRENAKGSILNSAFRLRKTHRAIETVSVPGRKEKFIVLTSWLKSDGNLKATYLMRFEEQVNMLKEASASLKGTPGDSSRSLRLADESAKRAGKNK